MKILFCVATVTVLLLTGCRTVETSVRCPRVSISPVKNRTLDVSFRRGATAQTIVLHLAWADPGAPFYTQYGPLQAMTLTEGATTVVVPRKSISRIVSSVTSKCTTRGRIKMYHLRAGAC